MTLVEVLLLIRGYNERLVGQYRQTRLLMFMMAKMWGDPKKGPKTPEEMWALPGDEQQKAGMDSNEIADLFERLKNKENG